MTGSAFRIVETGRVKVRLEKEKLGLGVLVTGKEMCRFLRKIVEENVVRWKCLFVGKFCLSAPSPPPAVCLKMSVVNLDTLSQDDLKKRVASLISLDDWADACLQCERPVVLHKSGACTRSTTEPPEIIVKVWKEFRDRTKSIVLALKAERRK